MNLISFREAIVKSGSKRHLLLGNGFSISCRSDIFLYSKLLERAQFTRLSSSARGVFDTLTTADFEKVIRALRYTRGVLTTYADVPKELLQSLENDANDLREILVETIAASHPEKPSDIPEEEFACCRAFLKNFTGIYTLNYDLLLYWAIMHSDSPSKYDDGFRKPENDPEATYVTWEANNSNSQNIWYLHGALHLFDAGTEVRKYTWNKTGVRLIEQIRDALNRDYFPLFVSEGKSHEKLVRIKHNDYLAKAYIRFAEIDGTLFIYGHSLAENDDHFLKKIENGKIEKLFVGIYGDPNTQANAAIIERAKVMPGRRRNRSQNLSVDFYDASTAQVWR